MSESDAQLKLRADKREHMALLCGIAVVVGLVIEVVLAAAFRGSSNRRYARSSGSVW